MNQIKIGMIGSGFAAAFHLRAYCAVCGVEMKVTAIASVDSAAADFAKQHGIDKVVTDYNELLLDSSIQVIDIVTPPFLHMGMIQAALQAGKFVICEKPLTGYFDRKEDDSSQKVTKSVMLQVVNGKLSQLETLMEKWPDRFLYAENYVYAPAVQRCAELLQKRAGKILYLRGEESHCGSHADHAGQWQFSGGGALIRQGCHPLAAILYLKYQEGERTGQPNTVTKVFAETGTCTATLTEAERRYIQARPVDVEDMAAVHLTFSDGSHADVFAGDFTVGGMRNRLELYTEKGMCQCNLVPEDGLFVYHGDEDGLADMPFVEKVSTKTGWQSIPLEEERMRGYIGEMQDLAACILQGKRPQSDFVLARDTIKIIYAAYLSAEQERAIYLEEI